jgi:serine/threonine-protein kinase
VKDEATKFELESAGKQVGRYRLAYEIASGGQASIFMAVADGPSGFGKVVALKRLHKHLAKEQSFISMFLDEARLASQLTHPNVCGVIDFGVEDGEYFMAMEYLTGVTVAKLASHAQKLAAQGKLDRELWSALVAHVVASAAEGLRAAHELKDVRGDKLNVVHRDVSPQNIMVGFDGSVRVMDFGIAKYDERETETSLGEVKGKYAYMSPEQARAAPIDHRTDIWALGVIAWELLTLRRLFKRETTAQTVLAVMNDEIEPPSRVEPSVPHEVDAAVLGAITRDLEQRTADARAFGSALRKAAGAADASDLAAWVQEAFPAAEAKARTMIDLARQSARGVPSLAKRDAEGSSSSINAPVHTVSRSGGGTSVVPPPPAAHRRWLFAGIGALVAVSIGAAVVGGGLGTAEPDEAPPASSSPGEVEAASRTAGSGSEGAGSGASGRVEPSQRPEAPTEGVDPPAVDPSAVAGTDPAAIAPDPGSVVTPPRVGPRAPRGTGSRPAAEPSASPAPGPTPTPTPAPAPTPTPAEPASAPDTPSTGTLVVVTPGTWANVYGPGGDLWGATPLRRSVAAGEVTVELRFEGQPPGRRASADVPGGGTGRIVERP